jgi:membrane protein
MRIWANTELPLREFLRRVYQKYENNTVSDTAAALSYYFIFSLFPFMFFLATLTAYLPLGHSIDTLVDRLRPVLPPQAMALIDQHLHDLVSRPRPKLLTIGILVTLYSASRGVDAVRKGLNLAYDVKESRPFWKTEALAFGTTIAGAVFMLVGVAALVAGGDAGLWVARRLGLGTAYLFAWHWLRWPVTAALIMLVAAINYYVLPDVKQRFKYITPGSIGGTLVWLLGTWGFSEYAGHFGTYNVTYGSIGGVIVLMTWLFISGFIFSMGGEINAILEHASRDGKAAGARVEGQAPPPPDERPSAMPPGAAANQHAAERSVGGDEARPH